MSNFWYTSQVRATESIRFLQTLSRNGRTLWQGTPQDDIPFNPDGGPVVWAGFGGNDILQASLGNDFLFGGTGNDSLYGLAGHDSLSGQEGNDYLAGGQGNDVFMGGAGNDTLLGGDGDDSLEAFWNGISNQANQNQVDVLTGGAGSDTFVLGGSWGVSYLGTGNAVITDFDHVRDYIQVRGTASQYRLITGNWGGTSARDTCLYNGNDPIALILDTTNVNFARDFKFV